MTHIHYLVAGAFWVLVLLRWRYTKRAARRSALLNVTGGYRRDLSERGGF
jgi:hypothetical protein